MSTLSINTDLATATRETGLAEADRNAPACNAPMVPVMVCFFGSGCAALIYEIVWFQMLQLYIGSTAVSLGTLLATFMGGLCLGSLWGPRIIPEIWSGLKGWAVLEVGIGLLAALVLVAVPFIPNFLAGGLDGFTGMLARGLVAGLLLLPATILMGATYPVAARCIETTPQGVSFLGLIYAANIAGAVFGTLLSGFYLLRVHDMPTANFVGTAMNVTVACGAWWLARSSAGKPAVAQKTAASTQSQGIVAEKAAPSPRLVYFAIGVSGFCALGAEVIWTRNLSLILGPTVYTFSMILAVFLAALSVGSAMGAVLARRLARPGFALAGCQLMVVPAVAWTAYSLSLSLPYWPINPDLSTSIWFTAQLDLLRCTWAIWPGPILWGASFPLALAAMAENRRDSSRLTGTLYAANTLGAIVGALTTSLLLVSAVGTCNAQRILGVLSACAALLILAGTARAQNAAGVKGWQANPRTLALGLPALLACAMLLASVPQLPWQVVAYGRNLPTKVLNGTRLYMGEGRNATVAVTQLNEKTRMFHVSGKVEASSAPQDMRLQRMLAHLPALAHPEPRTVLVVGCGAGVTAGSFLPYPALDRLVICEIEPLIPQQVTPWFAPENYSVLEDRRVQLRYEDARHYVLTTREKFDVITSDPIHPWVKGAATLFTREYLQMCKTHLNPGGLVSQWLPLYDSNLEAVKCAIATFMEVFPEGTIWSNCDLDEGYDVVLLGSTGPLVIDVDAMQKRLEQADHKPVAESLREVNFRSAFSLLSTYAGRGPDLQEWLRGAQPNLDRNLRLQYLAGFTRNQEDRTTIYLDLVKHRRYPEELFQCSSVWKQALRKELQPF